MDPKIFFWLDHASGQKVWQEQNFHACVACATEPRVGGGRVKKSVFLKYLLLNSNLDILDNFPNDGTIFPTASKKINQKAQGKKKLAGGGHTVI